MERVKNNYPKWEEGSSFEVVSIDQEMNCQRPNLRVIYHVLDGEYSGETVKGWFKRVNGRDYAKAAASFFECVGRTDLSRLIADRDLREDEWKWCEGLRGRARFSYNENNYLQPDWFFTESERPDTSNFQSIAEKKFWDGCQEGLKGFTVSAHQKAAGLTPDFIIEKDGNKMCVEIDGRHHADKGNAADDIVRDTFLISHKWPVVRISATLVMKNPNWVYQEVSKRFDAFYSAFEQKKLNREPARGSRSATDNIDPKFGFMEETRSVSGFVCGPQKKTKRVQVVMQPKQLEYLKQISESTGESVNGLMTEFIWWGIKEYYRKNKEELK